MSQVPKFGYHRENAPDLHYVKDKEKVEQTIWTVNDDRTAPTVNKTMQLIQKSLKYGKNIRNKTQRISYTWRQEN